MLTQSQKTALVAAIAADPALNTLPMNSDGATAVADAFNLPATPNFFVWKTSVNPFATMKGTGFDWTRVDNLSVGKARIMEWQGLAGTVDPSDIGVRNGINACFSVTVNDAPCRLAIFQGCQQTASRIQKLLITSGAGTTTTDLGVGPAVMGFQGPLSVQDVLNAWGQ